MLRLFLRLFLSFLLTNFAPTAEALQFRKIFAKNAANQYTPDEIQKLIFLPNTLILEEDGGSCPGFPPFETTDTQAQRWPRIVRHPVTDSH